MLRRSPERSAGSPTKRRSLSAAQTDATRGTAGAAGHAAAIGVAGAAVAAPHQAGSAMDAAHALQPAVQIQGSERQSAAAAHIANAAPVGSAVPAPARSDAAARATAPAPAGTAAAASSAATAPLGAVAAVGVTAAATVAAPAGAEDERSALLIGDATQQHEAAATQRADRTSNALRSLSLKETAGAAQSSFGHAAPQPADQMQRKAGAHEGISAASAAAQQHADLQVAQPAVISGVDTAAAAAAACPPASNASQHPYPALFRDLVDDTLTFQELEAKIDWSEDLKCRILNPVHIASGASARVRFKHNCRSDRLCCVCSVQSATCCACQVACCKAQSVVLRVCAA